jgi:hypothetical protein
VRSPGVELCDILGAIALSRIMRYIRCDRLESNYAMYYVRSCGVELCDILGAIAWSRIIRYIKCDRSYENFCGHGSGESGLILEDDAGLG